MLRRAVCVAALVLVTQPAMADVMEHFGLGARHAAMGGAGTAFADDETATLYNPAGLAMGGKRRISFGYRRTAYDLDLASTLPDKDRRAEDSVGDFLATEIGIVLPFGTPSALASYSCPNCGTPVAATTRTCPLATCRTEFEPEGEAIQPFAVGVLLFSPSKGGFPVSSRSAQVPQFVAYETGVARSDVVVAAAWRPRESLAVGAGVRTLADSNVHTQNDVEPGVVTEISYDTSLDVEYTPILGVQWRPLAGLTLGAMYREEQSLEMDGLSVTSIKNVPFVNGDIDIPTKLQTIALFAPRQAAIGAAWGQPGLTLAADLVWMDWSSFPGIGTQSVSDTRIGQTDYPGKIAQVQDPGFKDIFIPRLGVEYQAMPRLTLRGGYYYRPTPAPHQTGDLSLIDMTKHVVTAGVGTAFMDGAIAVDAYGQYHYLIEEDVQKRGPPPPRGTGDFTAKGRIWSAGVTVSYRF